jgi:hypothetical protein
MGGLTVEERPSHVQLDAVGGCGYLLGYAARLYRVASLSRRPSPLAALKEGIPLALFDL